MIITRQARDVVPFEEMSLPDLPEIPLPDFDEVAQQNANDFEILEKSHRASNAEKLARFRELLEQDKREKRAAVK